MSTQSASGSGSGGPQYFSLRWNNHPANLVSVFSGLFSSETLVDVTLAAEGKHIQAHKMLLSACSDYFQSLFSVNPCQHPIVILKDVHFEDLQTVVQFMYNGVVNVSSEKLPAVLKTADTLQIKGLGEKFSESVNQMMGSGYSSSSQRLLSVPSQHSVNSRQMSTESLPEYLHRTRSFSPRQASTDSRQYSIESSVSAFVRKQPTPPASPPRHYRKKFRRMSGGGSSSAERGNSLEDDRSPVHPATRAASPPAIHLSPSRQSSSSTDHGGDGMIVAKKKRELFSARSSRSGGSNKSSASDYSREHSFKPMESSGSSGERHSMNQSQDLDAAVASTSSQSMTSSSLTVPPSGRTLTRAQSAGEAQSSSAPPTKRNRFLKRQDCLEKGMDLTTDGVDTEIGLVPQPPTVKSSPNSPLMSTSYPGLGSPSDTRLLSPLPEHGPPSPHPTPILTKQKSNPLIPPPPPDPHLLRPSPYYSLDTVPPPPPPSAHLPPPHKLPSVRVIPDAALDHPSYDHQRLPVPNMRLLCPPDFSERRMPLTKSRSIESNPFPSSESQQLPPPPHHQQMVMRPTRGPISVEPSTATPPSSLTPPSYEPMPLNYGPSNSSGYTSIVPSNSHMASTSAGPLTTSSPSSIHLPPSSTTTSSSALASTSSLSTSGILSLQSTDQKFGHCPKAREGPALGCNYCWNTTDTNGRILRRKTKYHCPECQANLCIVPCFQQYHEALDREKGVSPH